jgi:hypothetical protein
MKFRTLPNRTFNTHDCKTYKSPDGRLGVHVDMERRIGNVLRELVRLDRFITLPALTQRLERRFNGKFKQTEILYCLNRLYNEVGAVTKNKAGAWKANPTALDSWADVEVVKAN